MKPLEKVECVGCERYYYIAAELIPLDIIVGDALPSQCPMCGHGYAYYLEPDYNKFPSAETKNRQNRNANQKER